MGIDTKKERTKFYSMSVNETVFDEIEKRRRELADFYKNIRKLRKWRVTKNDIIEDALKRSGHPLENGGKK